MLKSLEFNLLIHQLSSSFNVYNGPNKAIRLMFSQVYPKIIRNNSIVTIQLDLLIFDYRLRLASGLILGLMLLILLSMLLILARFLDTNQRVR